MEKTIHRLDPVCQGWVNNNTIYSWRLFLKRELLRERGYVSDYSGRVFHPLDIVDMHEGIVTRAVVQKSAKANGENWQYRIYHPYNCFLITREEHQQYGHDRAWALLRAYDLYGHDVVVDWFNSLPFKVRPFQLL